MNLARIDKLDKDRPCSKCKDIIREGLPAYFCGGSDNGVRGIRYFCERRGKILSKFSFVTLVESNKIHGRK